VTWDRSVVFSGSSGFHHDITEILLKVALNTIKQTNREQLCIFYKWKDDTDRHQVTRVLKITRAREFCLSSAILESVLLKNAIWYKLKETGTHGMMLNNAIFVVFNTRVPQNSGPDKNQNCNISTVCAMYHWVTKKIETAKLFCYIYCLWNKHTSFVGVKGLLWPWSYGSWIYNYLCN